MLYNYKLDIIAQNLTTASKVSSKSSTEKKMLGYAGTVSTACTHMHELLLGLKRLRVSKYGAKLNPTFLRSRWKFTRLGDAYTVFVTYFNKNETRLVNTNIKASQHLWCNINTKRQPYKWGIFPIWRFWFFPFHAEYTGNMQSKDYKKWRGYNGIKLWGSTLQQPSTVELAIIQEHISSTEISVSFLNSM